MTLILHLCYSGMKVAWQLQYVPPRDAGQDLPARTETRRRKSERY
jgi:hypothetical protein